MDAARERKRRTIVWVHPRAGKSRSDILASILGDAPEGSQVLSGNTIRDFIHDLFELLAGKAEASPTAAKTGRSVYLLHDANQQREVERADFLRDLIRQQSMTVLPDTRAALTREAHERFMQECDGLLLYRGETEGPDKWLFQNVSEVQFAEKMYQLRAPLRAKTLLLANPGQVAGLPDLDVLSYSEPVTADLLQPFFNKMREPGQAHVAN